MYAPDGRNEVASRTCMLVFEQYGYSHAMEHNVATTLLIPKVLSRTFAAGLQSIHVKSPTPTHPRRRSPATHKRECTRQRNSGVRIPERRGGISCDDQAVYYTHVKLQMNEFVLVSIARRKLNTGHGTTSSVPVLLCVALAGFAVCCEGVCFLPLLNKM